ncbi:MAG: hypothetical protein SCK29_03795 [Bacillota bacterium]|nr:hypothetical protein [Bacillota bacterium]MDW7683229.1 hypothetical protein [Bacillota bacterium]
MSLLQLIKLQLKVAYSLSALKWYAKHDKKKAVGFLGLAVLILFSLAPMYWFLYINGVREIYNTGVMYGQPELVLTLTLVFASLVVLFFGIGYIMSTFYFSRDLPVLIPLPFLPREIIGAKFVTVLAHEYLTILPFFLPVLFIYGLGQNAGIYYWFSGIMVYLFLPVIPLAAVAAVILFMMRVTNLGRRKDTLRFAGMVLLIAAVLVMNYFLNRLPANVDADFFQSLFVDNGLVNLISRSFPPALLATRAMAAAGTNALLNLLAYVGLGLAGFALMLYLGDRLFYQGLIGGDEIQSSKSISAEQLDRKLGKGTSPVRAIAAREIKLLIRTPIYLFNSVAMLLIIPIAMLLPMITGEGIGEALSQLQNPDVRICINLIAAAFIGGMAILTPAASSAFSREGKLFWVSKVIPVASRDQINGKILYSFIIATLAIPLLFLFSVLFVKWTVPEFLLISALGLCLSFPAITSSLLIDLFRPHLSWDNPQKAIKQNFNVFLGMLVGAGLLFVVYSAVRLAQGRDAGSFVLYAIVAVSALILGFIPYLIMLKIAEKRFLDIHVP